MLSCPLSYGGGLAMWGNIAFWVMVIIMGRKRIGQGRVTKECLLRGHVRYG